METPRPNVVTGALGYTGKYITGLLLSRGEAVRTITGHLERPNPFGDRISLAPLNFDDPGELARNLDGAEVLYNTYWVRFPHGGVDFDRAVAAAVGSKIEATSPQAGPGLMAVPAGRAAGEDVVITRTRSRS